MVKKKKIEKEEEEVVITKEEQFEDEEVVTDPIKNTMSDKTRYIIIGVISFVLLALIVVLAIYGNKTTKDDKNNKESNTSETRNTSTEFLKKFYEAFDSKEEKLIFFARSSCGYCNLQKPILENIVKDYDLDYFAIDTDTLSEVEVKEIMNTLGIDGSTPTSVVAKEGKVVNKNPGYLDGQEYVKFLSKSGILDEDAIYKEEKNIKSITYSEFKDIADKNKTSLILLDTSACSECITVRSLLSDLGEEYDFKVNYLFAPSLSQSEVEKLVEEDLDEMKYDEDSYKKDKQVSIPLLLVVKDNKIKDYVLKSTEKSDYVKVLKKYDFIK